MPELQGGIGGVGGGDEGPIGTDPEKPGDRGKKFTENRLPQILIPKILKDITRDEIEASMCTSTAKMRISKHVPPKGMLKFNILQKIPESLLRSRSYTEEQWEGLVALDPDWQQINDMPPPDIEY